MYQEAAVYLGWRDGLVAGSLPSSLVQRKQRVQSVGIYVHINTHKYKYKYIYSFA